MKRLNWIFCIGFLFFSTAALAEKAPDSPQKNTIKPTLILNHLKPLKHQETGGDELYMDIGVYRAQKEGRFFRIPEFPKNWPSSQSDKIKKIPLWSEPIKDGETVILILSLLEQDVTPMNPDDLLGIMRVKLKNEKGTLNVQWSIPNRSVGPSTVMGEGGNIEKFELFSEEGQYEVYLSLKQ
ncbi:Uncharacterised protein [Legionella londiniensis]|uniref:hypothetical protein n=3 Tax=Legionella londiniensis TaxID=45068 RepID=UPI000DFB98C8|nr:hypothetical protein [Legionella londiniensis]STX93816.1 Uncharacterised protein [Legionella londiniensis]